MKVVNVKTQWICCACLLAMLYPVIQGSVRPQTEAFLNRFEGTWQGEGKTLGMPAHLHMGWDWVLGNKFLRLTLRNEMRGANGQTQTLEGHAYYQAVGDGKYEARWFDSRGMSFPIKAQAEGDALTAFWGKPEQEQGKSVYRILASGKMEIVDTVLKKDGTWKDFGHFVLSKN